MRTARPLLALLTLLASTACLGPRAAAPRPVGPGAAHASTHAAPVDAVLPEYVPEPGVRLAGTLAAVGSDSMDPLLQLWIQDFQKFQPSVNFNVVSKGSATAPKALVAGTTLVGHMSREMNAEELAAFQAKYGYAPTRIVVAADALAVYVNVNNPVPPLHMEQVDAMFSRDRKGGAPRPLDTWGDLGLPEEWAVRPIHPYGRDENSGTRAFFREHALRKGEYRDAVRSMPDQFAVVEAVAIDSGGVAYGPLQHAVHAVRAVPLYDFKSPVAVPATVETVLNGKYPLTRFLYLYINARPDQPLDPLVREFLRFVLSRQGQASAAAFGVIPLPADLVEMNRRKFR
jgi:phosphate transport system substrate-binding protein